MPRASRVQRLGFLRPLDDQERTRAPCVATHLHQLPARDRRQQQRVEGQTQVAKKNKHSDICAFGALRATLRAQAASTTLLRSSVHAKPRASEWRQRTAPVSRRHAHLSPAASCASRARQTTQVCACTKEERGGSSSRPVRSPPAAAAARQQRRRRITTHAPPPTNKHTAGRRQL